MNQHLLLDLDGTLLENNVDVFIPAYFIALGEHLKGFIDPGIMKKALMAGTNAMIHKTDPQPTLEQAFDRVFYPMLGIPKEQIHGEIDRFYEEVFPALRIHTAPIPVAVDLVKIAFKKGYSVSVATNPLFPLTAILQRLTWAGLNTPDYPFELVSSYETFHFAKPNLGYYIEITNKIHASPNDCKMVGNDLDADIIPSIAIGIKAFHITQNPSNDNSAYTSGTIEQVQNWM
jgi:FMN phosphatase YigB (HAD superfamily)